MGDLKKDVGLFVQVDLLWRSKQAVLFVGSHPGRRQVKVLFLLVLGLLQVGWGVEDRRAVKNLDTSELDHLTQLLIELRSVELLRYQLLLELSFLSGSDIAVAHQSLLVASDGVRWQLLIFLFIEI